MTRLERILVASDLSAAGDEAIRQAADRAIYAKAVLTLCHVIPIPAHGDPLFTSHHHELALQLPELRTRIEEDLVCKITGLGPAEPGRFEVAVEEGTPHAVIVQKAEALGVGLIVVGPSEGAGLERLLRGSVSDRVIRHAHCPVLVARPRSGSGEVVVATDLSDPALPAVAAAAEEVRRTGAQLTVVHSVESLWPISTYEGYGLSGATLTASADLTESLRDTMEEQLRTVLESAGVHAERLVVEGPAADAILRVAEERSAELIVMGTVGRTGLKRVVLGSVAESVTRAAPCSVMVVRLHPSDPPGVE